jgi:predicted dehydrogenase
MAKKQITTVAEESARLLRENPTWKYYECIRKAKEMISNEDIEKMEKAN